MFEKDGIVYESEEEYLHEQKMRMNAPPEKNSAWKQIPKWIRVPLVIFLAGFLLSFAVYASWVVIQLIKGVIDLVHHPPTM